MLKKSASFVLAALGARRTEQSTAFDSSLAAAALDDLFDHPAGCSDAIPDLLKWRVVPVPKGFFSYLLGLWFTSAKFSERNSRMSCSISCVTSREIFLASERFLAEATCSSR